MSRAAIYARRSTERRVASELKSVTRQLENARAWAKQHSHEIVGEFVDDAISERINRALTYPR